MSARVSEIEDLREEVEVLRAALAEREKEVASRDAIIADRDETLAARDAALEELVRTLRLTEEERDYYRRRLFGKTSERLPAGPGLFDGQAAPPAETAPDDEESTRSTRERKQAERRRSTGRKPLPAALPRVRIEHLLPEEDRLCPDCSEPRQCIGEDTSEVLEYVPAHWVVHVHARGRYVCPRHPDQGVLTPLAAPRPIPGSYAGPGLLAHVLVSKYDDHLPLYRQAEIFRRTGVDLARSTLCDWVGGATTLLAPVAEAIRRSVLAQDYIQADETPVTVQEGPEGRPKEAYLWAYRGGGGRDVFFDFRMGRGREGPSDVLKEFRGTLQTDAYPGYDEIVLRNRLVAAGCMAHARRKFFEALESSPREAGLVLVLVRRLYRIEERAQGLPLEEVARLRATESVPAVADLKTTIEKLAAETTPATRLGKACSYALNQWTSLCVFLDDPRVAIDNNAIERPIRSVAVGRNNWLFCGNEQGGRRAALAYTLIESCKAAGVEPFAHLADILARLPGLPADRAAEFTPRAWAASRPR